MFSESSGVGLPTELPDREALLRRFDPVNINHVRFDEGTGDFRLRGGATKPRRHEDGLSVFRISILECAGEEREIVSAGRYSGIATARADRVLAEAPEVRCVADPLEDVDEMLPCLAAAHALITLRSGMGETRWKKVSSRVARAFSPVEVPDPAATLRALAS